MSSAINTTVLEANPRQAQHDRRRAVQERNAETSLPGFLKLVVQVMGLMLLFRFYHLESFQFLQMSAIVLSAFCIHYWVPFRFKEIFWVTVSIAGSFVFLSAVVVVLALGAGLAIYFVLHSSFEMRWRFTIVAIFLIALLYGCLVGCFGLPDSSFAVLNGIFSIRIIIYTYDVANSKERSSLLSFLSYFFILPTFVALSPIIDFQTMRATYYRRNIHEIAQQGIHWIVRGVVQLILYRVVVYFYDATLPDRITTLPKLITAMMLFVLLYLKVSGTFHVLVGLMHLFGYDLPETNRRYFLASSFLDYWRRANIYWKDFMLKIFYLPVYFKFRKRGDLFAQILGCATVFAVTWALHSEGGWISGTFSWPETIFWAMLGILVIANVVYDSRHKARQAPVHWRGRALLALRTAGTFATIAILWSIQVYPTMSSWFYAMTRWTRGGPTP